MLSQGMCLTRQNFTGRKVRIIVAHFAQKNSLDLLGRLVVSTNFSSFKKKGRENRREEAVMDIAMHCFVISAAITLTIVFLTTISFWLVTSHVLAISFLLTISPQREIM